ncbi:hypothetical protein ACHWQZ_G012201 [Mnemiopsis leidyi]
MLRFCCVVVLVVGLGALPPFRGAWKRPSALRSMNFKGQTFRPNKGQRQLLVRSEGAGDHCEDVGDAKDCEWWNEQGYCADDSEFHDAMIEQCAKTCGCGAEEELELEEVIVVKRDCENKGSAEDCAWWKEQGYCAADSEFNGAMMDQCPCTCEEKKVEEVLLVKRDCENKGSAEDCAWWKEQGYCAADSEFNGAMMDQCPCTCEGEELEAVLKRSAEEDHPDTELEERCADAVNYCNVLQQQGGCDLTGNSKFKLTGEFVEKVRNKLCQKTCGLC